MGGRREVILPRMPLFGNLKKAIASLVAVSFLFSNIAYADISKTDSSAIKQQTQITTDPSKVVIPRDFGMVKSRYAARDSNRLVIHIQDAHCNYEAQSNIIKILECLIKNDGLSLVSVEGADGFIDTSWFKAFPDADIRKEVADYFMKKGEITGPEFLSITTSYPIKLFGAETREYYIENLNAFTSSYPLKEDTEKYFNQIKAALNKLKLTIYSDELREFDAKTQDYESKKITFTDYVKYLEEMSGKYRINMRSYDNLFKLVSVLVYEKKINFNVVDKERSALIDAITKKLDKEQLTELVNKSLEFKTGKISSAEYYDYLKNSAAKYGMSLVSDYPNLFNYIIYNSVYSRIENEVLFKDIKRFEAALKEKLFANDDQRSLDKLSRHIDILLGLVNIRLLNDDFEYYKANIEEFAHEVFASFISKMSAKFGFAFEVDSPSDAVRESMSKLEDFYKIAIKRDRALVENTVQAMKKESAQISVLVTGGFHSEGIAKLLEQQGISYIVVCPNITKDVETPYIKILTNQRTPLEEILNDAASPSADAQGAKGNMLAPYLITAARMHAGELKKLTLGISDRAEAVFKEWAGRHISPWLPRARAEVEKKGFTLSENLAVESFKRDVDTNVEIYIRIRKKAGKPLSPAEIDIMKQNARDVKRLGGEVISKLLQPLPEQFQKTLPDGSPLYRWGVLPGTGETIIVDAMNPSVYFVFRDNEWKIFSGGILDFFGIRHDAKESAHTAILKVFMEELPYEQVVEKAAKILADELNLYVKDDKVSAAWVKLFKDLVNSSENIREGKSLRKRYAACLAKILVNMARICGSPEESQTALVSFERFFKKFDSLTMYRYNEYWAAPLLMLSKGFSINCIIHAMDSLDDFKSIYDSPRVHEAEEHKARFRDGIPIGMLYSQSISGIMNCMRDGSDLDSFKRVLKLHERAVNRLVESGVGLWDIYDFFKTTPYAMEKAGRIPPGELERRFDAMTNYVITVCTYKSFKHEAVRYFESVVQAANNVRTTDEFCRCLELAATFRKLGHNELAVANAMREVAPTGLVLDEYLAAALKRIMLIAPEKYMYFDCAIIFDQIDFKSIVEQAKQMAASKGGFDIILIKRIISVNRYFGYEPSDTEIDEVKYTGTVREQSIKVIEGPIRADDKGIIDEKLVHSPISEEHLRALKEQYARIVYFNRTRGTKSSTPDQERQDWFEAEKLLKKEVPLLREEEEKAAAAAGRVAPTDTIVMHPPQQPKAKKPLLSRAQAYSSPERFQTYLENKLEELIRAIPELEKMMSEYREWSKREIQPLEKEFERSKSTELRQKIDEMKKEKARPIDNLIRQKYNFKVAEETVGASLGGAGEEQVVRQIPTLPEFMKSPEYRKYLAMARELRFGPGRARIDVWGGAASRLFGEGQERDTSLSYAAHDVYEIALANGFDRKTLEATRSIFGLSIATRSMIQKLLNTEEELRHYYGDLGINKSDEEIEKVREQMVKMTPRIVIINDENGRSVIDEFLKNDFYGADPRLVVFVVQSAYHGWSIVDGKPVLDRTSALTPAGHGDATMQILQDSRAFTVDENGHVNMLEKNAVEYLMEQTKNTIKVFIQSRINDMTKLGASAASHPELTVNEIDMGIFALALAQMGDLDRLDKGNNVILEQVGQDKEHPVKGGSPLSIAGKKFLVEGLAQSDKIAELVSKVGVPFNRFFVFYKSAALKEGLRTKGLPVYFRFRDGYLYPEVVTGDITMLDGMNAGYVLEPTRQINDYKDVQQGIRNGVYAARLQDNNPKFRWYAEKFLKEKKEIILSDSEAAKAPGLVKKDLPRGAMRMSGGGITEVEHRGLEGSPEKSLNGAIDELIAAHKATLVVEAPGEKGLSPNISKNLELGLPFKNIGINLVIIQGLKRRLQEMGVVPDSIMHLGASRNVAYMDESDFTYLLTLTNGVALIEEALNHEKAHRKEYRENPPRAGETPDEYEARIEKLAPTGNVRKAFMLRDMKNKDIDILTISDGELAIKRTFGTNGIRSDDMGEEAQRRVAAGTAEVLKVQWQKANPGKELPWLLVGFDPRPQGANGFNPGEMGESKAVAETLAAYGFKVLFVPKPIAAPFMIAVTGKGIHPKNVYASVMRTASHNEVIDPKSGRLVSGVKLFIDNAPAADTVTNLISERINNRQLASMAPRVKFDKAVADGNIVVVKDSDENDPDTVEFNRLNRVFNLVKLGDTFRKRYPNLKIAINTMNGGMSNFALRIFKAMGFTEGKDFRAFNTTLMNDKALEAKVTGWIEYDDPATSEHKKVRFAPDPTRLWMRGEDYTKFVASDPSHIIALLIDGDADRLVAELEKEIIPNDIGMLAAYYLAKYKGQTGRIVRTVPTTGGLDALSKALGLGEVQVTPVGSKWFAGPNKYYSGTLNDILVAVEESGHIGFVKNITAGGNKELFFDHSIGLALLMLEMTAETGKTWQQLSDEMWAFIKDKTGQDRIAAVRFGINKDDGAEKYYNLVARLGNPKEGAFRKEFGAKFEEELAAAGLPWKVNDFDITDAGGAQSKFVGGRKLFPRKSGTDGSVRLYIEVLETERNKAPELVKIMRKVMDRFIVPAGKVSERELAAVLDQKLHKPLAAEVVEMAPKFMQGGYNQIGYGVPEGASIDGSFAIGKEGNQGYYVDGGKKIFLSTVAAMQKFFRSREQALGKPIRYIIKPGIGGQHTPFQGIADIFEMMDLETGKIVGEYELGKDYENSIASALNASGIDWDQVAVIPSSKSGSTDETMMIFTDIFNVMLKNIAAKEGLNGELFAKTVINTMNQVNIVGGKERPAGDLFKGFSINLVQNNLKAAGMRVEYEQVKKIFGIVLGNMFFETTDRPEQSRLSAFIRNSGLDKELGNNAPGFGAMFDNVGGRWTADLHMMTFLAYHKLNAGGYWFMRYVGIKSVRDGDHLANLIADKILSEKITDIALVVPDELFWFGKAMEQNFNESIWQRGFANLIAIKASDWKYQKKHYESNPSKLVLNMAERVLGFGVISKNKFNNAPIPCVDFSDTEYNNEEKAQSLANIFTTLYGMTHVVGNRLIVRALAEKGFTVDDVDLNDLNNPATKVFQQNLYLRQPYVELGKGLLEKKLKALQEVGPFAIDNEFTRILGEANKGSLTTNLSKLNMPPTANNAAALSAVIMKAAKYAKETNRKFVPMIYLEGGKFIDIREHLVKLGIEWVMQGTGDQHISYQQVLAQPQKFLPFIVSFIPEKAEPGLPSVGFAKNYLNNVSPNMVRDLFAEASYKALTEPRKNEAGEDVTGAAGIFLRLTDSDKYRTMLKQSFETAIVSAPAELSELERATLDAGLKTLIANAIAGAHLSAKLSPATEEVITNEAAGLSCTLSKIAAPEANKKLIVLGYDTALDEFSNAPARAGEETVNRYLNNTLVEVRASGAELAKKMIEKAGELAKQNGVAMKDIFMATITGKDTMKKIEAVRLHKAIGKVLEVENIVSDTERRPIPVLGLYDLVLRIAYEHSEEDILACLQRIANNGNGQPFTKDDIQQLLGSGFLRIIPRAVPVNMSEVAEVNRAAQAVARAL